MKIHHCQAFLISATTTTVSSQIKFMFEVIIIWFTQALESHPEANYLEELFQKAKAVFSLKREGESYMLKLHHKTEAALEAQTNQINPVIQSLEVDTIYPFTEEMLPVLHWNTFMPSNIMARCFP